MLHRILKLDATKLARAVGLLGLATSACDGDVEGWTLPNFPGDAGHDASVTYPADAGTISNGEAGDGETMGSTTSAGLPDAGATTSVSTGCKGDCGDAAAGSNSSTSSSTATSSSPEATTNTPDAGLPVGDAGYSICGDGVIEGSESCDDGNAVNEDECDNTCHKVTCGDSIVEGGEECDPPTAGECGSKCQRLPPRCGDGVLQVGDGEGCDDGNSEPNDGCFECGSLCGNGEIDQEEQCEPGFASLLCLKSWNTCIPCSIGDTDCESRDVCDPLTCKGRSACGNGTIDLGESCDPPGSERCDARCQLLPKECGNGVLEFGEACDPPDDEFCNAECRHISCGNQVVEGQEECDPPNGLTCDESCHTKAPCEAGPPPPSLLPVDGTFTSGISGWVTADSRVALTHNQTEGLLEAGSLSIELDNGATGGAAIEIRGATLCMPVARNTTYTFSGAFKFPAGVTADSGTSVSLYLYSNLSCTGQAIEASKVRGPKGFVSEQWETYQNSVNTAVAGESEFLSLMIRVDVWRPSEATEVSVLWDDLALTDAGVQADGYCGDCQVTGTETCDDGNALGGDGCNSVCVAEGCLNGFVDDGEACDDGNLTFYDGCDPDCTTGNACRQCGFTSCTEPANDCYQDTTPVTAGIGKGKSSGQLCSGLVECVERTGCALPTAANSLVGAITNRASIENCYCGTARGEDCMEPGIADGSCKLEIEAAVETSDPVLVLQRVGLSNDAYPAYSSAKQLWTCVSDVSKPCVTACVAQPACGNGQVGERPEAFLDTLPRTFDGTSESALTCRELATASCFYEECDDGNALDGDGCDTQCFREECGNGVLQVGSGEACDDGNTDDDDGCSASCQFEWVCGDMQLDPNEDCDDGNDIIGDGCDENCFAEECGNSIVQINEQCDPPNGSQCLPGCVFAPLDPCTECLLEMGDEPLGSCAGAYYLDGDPTVVGPYQCLGDPLCDAVWNCLIETRCAQSDVASFCFCGPDPAEHNACIEDPSFVPRGECASEMTAAYESQFDMTPTNGNMIQFAYSVYETTLSLGAATSTYASCMFNGPGFDNDMCLLGFTPQRRFECAQACYGEEALTEDEILGEDCLPQSNAPVE